MNWEVVERIASCAMLIVALVVEAHMVYMMVAATRNENLMERRRRHVNMAECYGKVDPSTFDFSKLKKACELERLSYEEVVALLSSPEGRENARRQVEEFYGKREG